MIILGPIRFTLWALVGDPACRLETARHRKLLVENPVLKDLEIDVDQHFCYGIKTSLPTLVCVV